MQKKFYTAKIDAMFKAIFCNPNNTELLKGLIEKCLKEKIEVIEIKSPEVVKKNIYEKGKVLDVLVYSGDRYINIEIKLIVAIITACIEKIVLIYLINMQKH